VGQRAARGTKFNSWARLFEQYDTSAAGEAERNWLGLGNLSASQQFPLAAGWALLCKQQGRWREDFSESGCIGREKEEKNKINKSAG
jgi:hypothetical protein